MRSFSPAERRARLGRRHFLAAPVAARSAAAAVPAATAALVGWHATDPATPYLSLWSRVADFTVAELDRALYEDRCLVKHLAMRRTLWVFPVERLASVQAGSSNRVADNERRKLIADVEKAGVAEDGAQWLAAAATAVRGYLGRHGHATASELRAALPELAGTYDPAPGKRWGGAAHLAPRVLTVLAAEAQLVRGPNDGGWTTSRPRWAGTAAWLGSPVEVVAPEPARAELMRAWLRAFGPASLTDIKWWFGATATATRQALAAVDAVEVDLHGAPGYALADDLEPEPDPEPWAALLPSLDPTTMGWSQRDWYLGGHRDQVFDHNGNAGPTAWVNGRIVGGWRQDADARVQLQPLEDIGRDEQKLLHSKAAELTEWLDGTRIAARFPSPLSKQPPATR